MRMTKSFILSTAILSLLISACGKDRKEPPSNREGYTDGTPVEPGKGPQDGSAEQPPEDEPVLDSAFIVEVNAFETEEAAMKLSRELRLARISNEIEKLGPKKFRVIVGKRTTRERAEKTLAKIIDAGFVTAKVVPVAGP